MNEFKKMVKKILKELGFCEYYEFSENEDISMTLYKNETSKEIQYYIVSNCKSKYFENLDIIKEQSSIYNLIKENIYGDPAFDKNTSWIIGLETDKDFNEIEQKILSVEEDPYCFKKMVFTYSSEEILGIQKELTGSTDIISYMQKELSSVKRFNDFYNKDDIVYGFISRLLIKLPIIKIKVERNQNIGNLKQEIESEIEMLKLSKMYIFLQDDIDNKTKMIDTDINEFHKLYLGKVENDEEL